MFERNHFISNGQCFSEKSHLYPSWFCSLCSQAACSMFFMNQFNAIQGESYSLLLWVESLSQWPLLTPWNSHLPSVLFWTVSSPPHPTPPPFRPFMFPCSWSPSLPASLLCSCNFTCPVKLFCLLSTRCCHSLGPFK